MDVATTGICGVAIVGADANANANAVDFTCPERHVFVRDGTTIRASGGSFIGMPVQ